MGRFKPAKGQRRPARASPGAVPCVILVLGALILFSLIIYGLLSTNAT